MGWLGCCVFGVAAACAFAGGSRAGRRGRAARWSAVLLAALTLCVAFRYQPVLAARLLPVSLFASLDPWISIAFALAFFGSAIPQVEQLRTRRAVWGMAAFLFALSLWGAWRSAAMSAGGLTGVPDAERGLCRQTSGFSCGAAASSTWLAQLGIHATEAEMASRCATNVLTGTGELGVLKGLGEKLAGTNREVELRRVEAESLDEVPLPALAIVEHSAFLDHWVVLLACENGLVTVADPLFEADDAERGLRMETVADFRSSFDGLLICPSR